jgi:Tol biopolymer transport system component
VFELGQPLACESEPRKSMVGVASEHAAAVVRIWFAAHHPDPLEVVDDLRKIAFTSEYDCACDDPSELNINVVNASGAGPHGAYSALTTDGVSQHPSWSPDGMHIAYDRGYSRSQIHVMDANGKHKRRLTSSRATNEKPAWSP